MKKLYIVIIALSFMLTACGNQSHSTIIVVGSNSVQPYAEILLEAFTLIYPEIEIDIQGGGSTAGITSVENGIADIGMISRELAENERHLIPIEIAKDGLAIIIHPNNPVSDVTLEQIRGIYKGTITKWKEVGGVDREIHVITREEGSGTRKAFEDLVMHKEYIYPRAIVQSSNGAIKQLVAGDKNAIGFISLGLVDQTVKALRLDGIEASDENIINGKYGLFRPFLYVTKDTVADNAQVFIEFTLSSEGQQILVMEGLIGCGDLKALQTELEDDNVLSEEKNTQTSLGR